MTGSSGQLGPRRGGAGLLPLSGGHRRALGCPSTDDATDDEPPGLAEWSGCVDYPTGVVTCSEVCIDQGKVCARAQCDGYTARQYNWASCTSSDDVFDRACSEEFDVSTSRYASAECCCW